MARGKQCQKGFQTWFIDARSSLLKKQGNRKYVQTYPDVAVLGISMQDVRNHRRFCVEVSGGDLSTCKTHWMNALNYFTERAGKQRHDLQEKFVDAFEAWLAKHADSLAFIVEGF